MKQTRWIPGFSRSQSRELLIILNNERNYFLVFKFHPLVLWLGMTEESPDPQSWIRSQQGSGWQRHLYLSFFMAEDAQLPPKIPPCPFLGTQKSKKQIFERSLGDHKPRMSRGQRNPWRKWSHPNDPGGRVKISVNALKMDKSHFLRESTSCRGWFLYKFEILCYQTVQFSLPNPPEQSLTGTRGMESLKTPENAFLAQEKWNF